MTRVYTFSSQYNYYLKVIQLLFLHLERILNQTDTRNWCPLRVRDERVFFLYNVQICITPRATFSIICIYTNCAAFLKSSLSTDQQMRQTTIVVCCVVCVIITNYPGSNMHREIIHFIYINCNTNFSFVEVSVPLMQLHSFVWHMYTFKLQKRPPILYSLFT